MSSEPKLPSEIEFASFLVYNPRPSVFASEISVRSRQVRTAIKKETASWARRHKLGERMHAEVDVGIRDNYLSENTTLVPMPGHAPMKNPASHWSSKELCEVLVDAGLGARWLPLLERTEPVPKAAFSVPEDRPTARRHLETLRALPDLMAGGSITVVDDVVTRGATMLAAVARLREAYPNAVVRGFALIRTMSSEPISAVKAPCTGVIRLTAQGTYRQP